MKTDEATLKQAIRRCYRPDLGDRVPLLFDGVGRTYTHRKACFYFFSWLIRDAPQQRLSPLIQRIRKETNRPRMDVEIDVLAALMLAYRHVVKTFSWDAIREVIIDRLEGSRRSIKGHEKEVVVRTAIATAIQTYYEQHDGYGLYHTVEMASGQFALDNETYDVVLNLYDGQSQIARRLLVPIKTRETEGGGHAHLFTRDILSAINIARRLNSDDAIMVAKNWSTRETDTLESLGCSRKIQNMAISKCRRTPRRASLHNH